MNVLYQVFFGALSLLLLVWLADTIRSISSRPVWAQARQDETTFAPKPAVTTTTTATIEAAKAIASAKSAAVKPGRAPVREEEKEEAAATA